MPYHIRIRVGQARLQLHSRFCCCSVATPTLEHEGRSAFIKAARHGDSVGSPRGTHGWLRWARLVVFLDHIAAVTILVKDPQQQRCRYEFRLKDLAGAFPPKATHERDDIREIKHHASSFLCGANNTYLKKLPVCIIDLGVDRGLGFHGHRNMVLSFSPVFV